MTDTLFDLGVGFDEPRARVTDPETSHCAADKSADTRAAVRDAVLLLVRQEEVLTGSEANRLYLLRRDRYGWPEVHIDSPRKRLGDLARDGLLTILNPGHTRGTETEYSLFEATA